MNETNVTDKNLIALADSFMAIFGFKRIGTIKDNVITPAKFEKEKESQSPNGTLPKIKNHATRNSKNDT